MSLREEIIKLIASRDPTYHTCNGIMDCTIEVIEKRIDSIMQREIADSHHFEIQQRKNDLSTTDAIVRICREIKQEMLK